MIGLIVMGSFHLARAAILTHVAGFGERVFPLGRLGTHGCLGHWPKLMRCFRENRRLHDGRKFGDELFHVFISWLPMKSAYDSVMKSGEPECICVSRSIPPNN
jgi:hypothetical protein